jgi:hypothetical protein
VNIPLPADGLDLFRMQIGSTLVLTSANGLPSEMLQAQYNNGVFVGFAFFADFMINGISYELMDQGGQWTIYLGSNGVVDFTKPIATGSINRTLTNIRDYQGPDATVPEPATLALVATGLLPLGAAFRSRRRRR